MDQQSYQWHQSSIDAILQKLNTDAACGLSHKAARSRYRKGGSNRLFDVKKESDAGYWLRFFKDPSLIFFLCVCLLAIFFSEFGAALTSLGFFLLGWGILWWIRNQKRSDEKKIESFGMPVVTVVREGKAHRVLAKHVVVGDILLLKRGDILPCDCRLIEGEQIVVKTLLPNEKGDPIWQIHPKQADLIYPYGTSILAPFCENMLYAGSQILRGYALAVAVEIGENTFLGSMEGFVMPTERSEKQISEQSAAFKSLLSRYTLFQYFSLIPLVLLSIFLSPSSQSILYALLSLSALLATGSQAFLSFLFQTVIDQAEHDCLHSSVPENKAILKADGIAERLSRVTDVIVLGHSAVSDRRVRLVRCALGNGSVALQEGSEIFALQSLCEALLIREYAQTKNAVFSGESGEQGDLVLQDLLKYSAFDRDALSVRLLNADMISENKHAQTVTVTTKEAAFSLHFSENFALIDSCHGYDDCGVARVFSQKQREYLKSFSSAATEDGCKLLFVSKQTGTRSVFLGALALREEMQSILPSVLEEYRQSNLRVSFFLFGDPTSELRYAHAAKLPPKICRNDGSVSLLDAYLSNRVFLGFPRKEILNVICALRKQGRQVAVIGNDLSDLPLLNAASVSVGCAKSVSEGTLNAALTEEESSVVRCDADILIPTASRFGGGLSSLLQTIGVCRGVHHRAKSVFHFLLVSRMLTLMLLFLGLCTGGGLLSAGLLMQLGWGIVPLAVLWLLSIPVPQQKLRKLFFFRFTDMKKVLASKENFVPALGVGGLLLLTAVPLRVLGIWSATDGLSFVFGSLILLQLVALLWSGQALGKRGIRKRDLLLLLIIITPIALEGVLALFFPNLALAMGLVICRSRSLLALPVLPMAFLLLLWIFLRKKKRTAK